MVRPVRAHCSPSAPSQGATTPERPARSHVREQVLPVHLQEPVGVVADRHPWPVPGVELGEERSESAPAGVRTAGLLALCAQSEPSTQALARTSVAETAEPTTGPAKQLPHDSDGHLPRRIHRPHCPSVHAEFPDVGVFGLGGLSGRPHLGAAGSSGRVRRGDTNPGQERTAQPESPKAIAGADAVPVLPLGPTPRTVPVHPALLNEGRLPVGRRDRADRYVLLKLRAIHGRETGPVPERANGGKRQKTRPSRRSEGDGHDRDATLAGRRGYSAISVDEIALTPCHTVQFHADPREGRNGPLRSERGPPQSEETCP